MSFTLNEKIFEDQVASLWWNDQNKSNTMTLNWTIWKISILFIIMLISAWVVTYFTLSNPVLMPYLRMIWIWSLISAFVLWLIMSFKPNSSPYISPIYAVLEWVFVAAVSIFYSAMFEWIVLQAVVATLWVFAAMLVLYRTWIIVVDSKFKSMLGMAVWWVMLIYVATILWSLTWWFNIPYIHGSGAIWIWFSVLVIWIASLTLANEFDEIETWVQLNSPKYMEWYAWFSMLSAIVWLYIEILRLLAKIQSND